MVRHEFRFAHTKNRKKLATDSHQSKRVARLRR
jgi:hypothetical protein